MCNLTEGPAGTYTNAAVPDGSYLVAVGSDGTGYPITVYGEDVSEDVPFFTVSVVTNGGKPAVPRQVVAKDDYVSAPYYVTRPGYTLDGWFTDEALTTQWIFGENFVNAPITLYARWAERAPVTLDTPTEFAWDAGTPGMVTLSISHFSLGRYNVALYKDGVAMGAPVYVECEQSEQTYDFSWLINESGS